jgi:hypothetical protein
VPARPDFCSSFLFFVFILFLLFVRPPSRRQLLKAVYALAQAKGAAAAGTDPASADAATAAASPLRRGQDALAAAEAIRGGRGHGAAARRRLGDEGGRAGHDDPHTRNGRARFAGHGYDYLAAIVPDAALDALAADAPADGARLAADAVADAAAARAAELARRGLALEAPEWLRPATDGARHAEGCMVFGSVEAARAPGQVRGAGEGCALCAASRRARRERAPGAPVSHGRLARRVALALRVALARTHALTRTSRSLAPSPSPSLALARPRPFPLCVSFLMNQNESHSNLHQSSSPLPPLCFFLDESK